MECNVMYYKYKRKPWNHKSQQKDLNNNQMDALCQ